jgi:hypothetical protein
MKYIILVSKERDLILFDKEYIHMSKVLYTYFEGSDDDPDSDPDSDRNNVHNNNQVENTFPVPHLSTNILIQIMEFMKINYTIEKLTIPMPIYNEAELTFAIGMRNKQFLDKNKEQLLDLIFAADYLDIPMLLHIGCAKIAVQLKSMSISEIRTYLHLDNDLNEEEIKHVIEENNWYQFAKQ